MDNEKENLKTGEENGGQEADTGLKDDAPSAEGVTLSREEYDALVSSREESDKYRDQLLRARADFDNFRKRTAREYREIGLNANERLLKSMLAVFDDLALALKSAEKQTDAGTIIDGLRMIQKKFSTALKDEGINEIEALDREFDPRYHEAVAMRESAEHADNTVVEEIKKGYMFNERIIRPASVIVSRKPAAESRADGSGEGQNEK